jgi:hypothetical protein
MIDFNGSYPSGQQCAPNSFGANPLGASYLDYAMTHEIFHALGAVQNAPHGYQSHVNDDGGDIMYWQYFPANPILDAGKDDYYIPWQANSYWNIDYSPYFKDAYSY